MELFVQLLPGLWEGTQNTIGYFIVTLCLSLPCAIAVVMARLYGCQPLSWMMRLYIYLMQGTPLLLQLVFVYFGLPYLGINFSREIAAGIAFVLNYAAYFAEIFRGGIVSLDPGQTEASKVLGFSSFHMFRRIVFPQVIKNTMPSIGNECLTLLKDTALISVLGLSDVLKIGKGAANTHATAIPFLFVAGIYLVLSAVISFFLKKGEKRFRYYA